jgi:diguanylate cyclase (GGDEF)-like protein
MTSPKLADPFQADILVVDDNPHNVRLLLNILGKHGYKVRPATTGPRAVAVARTESPDLILLDIMMPGTSGYTVGEQLGADEGTRDIPIIFISALDDVNSKVKAFQSGGVDYITKPFQAEEVLARVKTHLSLRGAQEQLAHAALHDPLTGLPNRSLLNQALEGAIARIEREADYAFALLFLDLDQFKVVNDSLGHTVGDQLLVAVGRRLKACLGTGDTVARMGGDEFVVLLDAVQSTDEALRMADCLGDALVDPFEVEDYKLFISASIGIVPSLTGHRGPDAYLRDASTAMYQAKRRGGGSYAVFDAEMHAEAMLTWRLGADLRQAVERGEFRVHYQPIVKLADKQICGTEALLRWQHPQRGLLDAAGFVPLLEETGLIDQVGEWVLGTACAQTQAWHAAGHSQLWVAVNLSARQTQRGDLAQVVEAALKQSGLPAQSLMLEITESMDVKRLDGALTALQRLNDKGVAIAIDDFGTGPALDCLRHLPANVLKIDRSFVEDLAEDGADAAIVRAMVALAHSLNLAVIAEGVERGEQLEVLRSLGVDQAQGHLFSPPAPAETITTLLEGPGFVERTDEAR